MINISIDGPILKDMVRKRNLVSAITGVAAKFMVFQKKRLLS